MEYKQYTNKYILRLDPGEEIVESITKIAETEKIKLASVTGIGAINKAKIGVFDTKKTVSCKWPKWNIWNNSTSRKYFNNE